MAASAHIYDKFAPRFTDRFHVIALTRRGHGDSDYPETGYDVETLTEDVKQFMDALKIDKAILAGHSMAKVELCHFAALHPERLLKLIFLDAAYDSTSPVLRAMNGKSPLRDIPIPGVDDEHDSIEEYVAAMKKCYPFAAAGWAEVMDEEMLHEVRKSPEGKIVDRMPDTISQALMVTSRSYVPEYSNIQVPVLSIFAIPGSAYYLSPDYMTEEQKVLVIEFYDIIRPPLHRELIEQFRRSVPHAKIVVISNGHHNCFIKHEELVFDEMRKFLLL
jgi:pimeloyl-ACP methyl ester carboxylesterase